MSAEPREPFIEFDPDEHVYYVDGARMRFSVTEVLQKAGYLPDEQFFAMMEEQRQRGTAVHAITAEIDAAKKGCDFRRVTQKYRGYVRGWEKWKRDHNIVEGFQYVEHIVTCPELDYAGTLDRANPFLLRLDPTGAYWQADDELIDLKTNDSGTIYHNAVRLQLVGYGHALDPRRMRKRRAVCLKPDGTYTQQIYSVLTWQSDLAEWFQALQIAKGEIECQQQ